MSGLVISPTFYCLKNLFTVTVDIVPPPPPPHPNFEILFLAGIQTSENAHFYATSAKFDSFSNRDKTLVIQFTVKHEQKIDCGGGYIKVRELIMVVIHIPLFLMMICISSHTFCSVYGLFNL